MSHLKAPNFSLCRHKDLIKNKGFLKLPSVVLKGSPYLSFLVSACVEPEFEEIWVSDAHSRFQRMHCLITGYLEFLVDFFLYDRENVIPKSNISCNLGIALVTGLKIPELLEFFKNQT